MSLNVNAIFYTIQGEGPYIGRPSIFIRLSGCNLQCIWCDTKYTWLFSDKTLNKLKLKGEFPETKHFDKTNESKVYSTEKLIGMIKKYPSNHIVITGGEPLLQKSGILKLINKLDNYTFEIESNGTIKPIRTDAKIHYNISPKLSNSLNDNPTIFPEVLKLFLAKKAIFKFVMNSSDDLIEILSIIKENNITKEKIYLMPQAANKEELERNADDIIELCKKYDFRYSHRLHIHLYDTRRGV